MLLAINLTKKNEILLKLKKQHELLFFFLKKGKKNRKVSKAIEQPSIKSIQNPIAQ